MSEPEFLFWLAQHQDYDALVKEAVEDQIRKAKEGQKDGK